MKRSEMLKIIERLFDIAQNHDNETNAENLLCHLEEAGMLPPTILINEGPSYKNASGELVERNQWEEE